MTDKERLEKSLIENFGKTLAEVRSPNCQLAMDLLLSMTEEQRIAFSGFCKEITQNLELGLKPQEN